MQRIRPVSDLRNNFAEITKDVQSSKEPVFLTKNGAGSLVVMIWKHMRKAYMKARSMTSFVRLRYSP